MSVVAKPCASGLRKRRDRCDEECLRRIAARLCRLDEACAVDGAESASSTGCCVPERQEPAKSSCNTSKDDCCRPDAATESCCDSDKDETTDCCDSKATSKGCCDSKGKATSTKSCQGSKQTMENITTVGDKCVDDCCTTLTDASLLATLPCDNEEDAIGEKDDDFDCVDDCCKPLLGEAESPARACNRHLQTAFDRFEAVLRNGLCLCRQAHYQLGFCCCSVTPGGLLKPSAACRKHEAAARKASTSTQRSRIPESKSEPIKGTKARVQEVDVENAAAREHVVARVSGMTCTGCSKKMMNVLTNISGVTNLSVAFVSETAEWDLESTLSVNDVLRRVEKETGFTVIRVVAGYQNLDVYMSEAAARHLETQPPDGLVSMIRGKKGVYELTYNPRTIGARSLVPSDATLAPPHMDKTVSEGRRRLHNMVASFGVSAVLTIPIVILNWGHLNVSPSTSGIISLVLATGVQGIAIPEFYVRAIKSLVYSRVLEMDLLVVISITAAYVYSVIAFGLTERGIHLEQGAFFETSSLLVTLVLLGRLMSAFARVRAVSSVSLRSLQAETAVLVLPDGQTSRIDARLLQFGDTIRVPPHSRVVTDGKVVSGDSTIDESIVTGESTPVCKQPGDEVVAGTINDAGTLDVCLTRLPGENSITDISNLVENAIGAKPRIQDLADKVASYFVSVVIVVSFIIFLIWIGIAIKVRHRNGGGAIGLALTYGIASLAVSCPCALGLAVPMVLVVAGGVAARAGVIIKAADATERGCKTTDVVFDKTGTLTTGDLRVVRSHAFETILPAEQGLSLLKALLEGNDHPVSVAVSSHLVEHTLANNKVDKVQSIPGAGIQATFQGRTLKAGNPYWLGLDRLPEVAQLLDQAMTILCVTLDDQLLLLFGLKSSIRKEAPQVLAELRRRNINCHVVSGDAPQAVQDVANILGIDPTNVLARSSPAEKQQYVRKLQDAGRKVIFVGDGVNDAVAVAQANVGVQIGSASDVTGAVADVVLLGGLDGVLVLLDVSRRAFNRIKFNFAWTAIYNVFAILMAAGAFVKFRIPPAYAGLGEIASVGPVIIAAMTLTFRGSRSYKGL